jgi:multimeric flavodoxin WrbA
MKVVAVCGSPRKDGNTERALAILLEKVAEHGVQTELVALAGKKIGGCIACGQCGEKKDGKCYGRKDDLNEILDICRSGDALILGTPVYFGSATPEIKCLIDRLGYTTRHAIEDRLARKIGGAVVVARRAGQNFTFGQISYFFGIMGMVQVGSSYWNILFGREKGQIESDAEGVATLHKYADNVVWLLRKTSDKT